MTFTTPNGIRRPDNPTEFADLIKFFKEMAEDVDTKFVPKNGSNAVTGTLSAKTLRSTNGGTTQAATVLQTGPTTASCYNVYDDNVRVDNSAGRRLWIAGPNNTDVAIRTRSGSESLNRISMAARTVDITGAVTINGTLNITGTKTVTANYESDYSLAANQSAWRLVLPPGVGFTFVTPPSGAVTIGLGASMPTQGTWTMLSYDIMEGASVGSGTLYRAVAPGGWPTTQPTPHGIGANGTGSGSTQWSSVYNAYLHTNLKPNFTYNVRPWYRNANTVALTMFRHYFIVTPDL
jgi:hypothetical protein